MTFEPSLPPDLRAAAEHMLRRALWTSGRERAIARAVLERQAASPKQAAVLLAAAARLREAEAEARGTQ